MIDAYCFLLFCCFSDIDDYGLSKDHEIRACYSSCLELESQLV